MLSDNATTLPPHTQGSLHEHRRTFTYSKAVAKASFRLEALEGVYFYSNNIIG